MPSSFHRSDHRDGAVRIVREADEIIVLCLEGEFDRYNAPALGTKLERALQTRKDLILDLSQATFVDSSIINELFRAANAADENGQTAVLQLGTAPLVERVLEIAGIESVLPRATSREEAVQIVESRAPSR